MSILDTDPWSDDMLSTLRGYCGRALAQPPSRVPYHSRALSSYSGGGGLPPRPLVTVAETAEQLAQQIVMQTPSAELDKLLKQLQRIIKHPLPSAVERTAKLPKDLTWLHHWLLRAVDVCVQAAKKDSARSATKAAARAAGTPVRKEPFRITSRRANPLFPIPPCGRGRQIGGECRSG